MTAHSQPGAAYVRGTIRVYDLEGRHDRMESELITSHEQFHHMLREKSSFGMYLTQLLVSIAHDDTSARSFPLQALASRFRTSDEVLATFASSRMAMWHYGDEPIRTILGQYRMYAHYFGIGESLVAADALPLLAATSMEAIIRFCWSPAALTDLDHISIADLYRQLPPDQFPDKRLERFIAAWSVDDWRKMVDAMTVKIPGVEAALVLPYMQLLDPTYETAQLAKAQDKIFLLPVDSQVARALGIQRNRELLNQLTVTLIWAGYDFLSEKFRETSLASADQTALRDFKSRKRAAGDGKGPGDAPETLFVRTSLRRVQLLDSDSFTPWEYVLSVTRERVAPVFIRPMATLRRHLELPAAENTDVPVLYSIHAGRDVNLDPLETRLIALDGWQQVAQSLAGMSALGPAIVWTSDAMSGKLDVEAIARVVPVWCVCDTPPLPTIRWLQRFIPEIVGQSIESRVPGSSLKAFVACRLGDGDGVIDGIVFPGTATMTDPVGSMLFQVYGDDCRGVNVVGPSIRRSSIVREKTGLVIANFISITDRWFMMS